MARALSAALVGIAVILAVITGLGIAALYHARQRYEDRLSVTSGLQVAAANLLAAATIEEVQFVRPSAPSGPAAIQRATGAHAAAATQAGQLAAAAPDAATDRFLGAETQAEHAARELAARPGAASVRARRQIGLHLSRARHASVLLAARQAVRREDARHAATSATRRAVAAIVISGGFALVAVLLLVAALLRTMRAPLGELVDATRRMAGGDLNSRVAPAGPTELRTLGEAFNRMGDDLAGTTADLEAERRRLAITIESLGDGLILCEADGRIAAANPRAGELVPELRPGRRADDAGSPLPKLAEALRGEVIVERPEGQTLAITAARLGGAARSTGRGGAGGAGSGAGVIWTVRDVTERARLERAKTEFVATASHELRSPLTSIKGYAELLGSTGSLTERQSEFVRIIAVSANRLTDLVNDLLDVAKIEAGNVELYRRSTDLREVVLEAVDLLRPRLADKQQTLELDVDQPIPQALVDPGRVRQIVTNLLTNAHLYTGEGGTITVAAARRRPAASRSPSPTPAEA